MCDFFFLPTYKHMFDVNIIAINAYIPFTLNLFSPLALLTLFKSLLHSYQFYDWFCDHTFNFPRSHTLHAWGKFATSPNSNKQKYLGGFIGNILLIFITSDVILLNLEYHKKRFVHTHHICVYINIVCKCYYHINFIFII